MCRFKEIGMTAIFRGLGRVNLSGFVKIYPTPEGGGGPGPGPGPASWNEYSFTGSDSLTSEETGYSVAISKDGNWLVMGARGKGNDDTQNIDNYYGAAYVYNWNGSDWTEVEKLTLPGGDISLANFGFSVAINQDGTKIAVGAADPFISTSYIPAVYLYDRSGMTITHAQTIQPVVSNSSSLFGHSIDMSDDGTRIVVGSPYYPTNGSIYIFHWNGTNWIQYGPLSGSAVGSESTFGFSVGINGSGTKLVVGDPYNSSLSGTPAGKAYAFIWNGSAWVEEAVLAAGDPGANDHFGCSVSISGNGDYIAIGAKFQEVNVGSLDSGAAYIFYWNGSAWAQQQRLKASDNVEDLMFGFSVDLDSTGSRVVVGANAAYLVSEIRGAYIFNRSGVTWSEEIKIQPGNPGLGSFDYKEFGFGISISNNGLRFAVASRDPGIVEGSPSDTGRIHVFHYE
jgi:hypothetical protein